MGVKFANPPLDLCLKYHGPPRINDKIWFLQYTRVSQYYESSKYISNLFFVMPYTNILDDSIKSPTLILTADHSTLLFLPAFFYKIKNSFFLLWVNLYVITDTYLHNPPPFNGPFFMTPPFSAVSKSCDPPSVSTPPPSPPANF